MSEECRTFVLQTTEEDGGDCDEGVPLAGSTITLAGKTVPPECFEAVGSSCDFEICFDDLDDGIAALRINIDDSSHWFMQLLLDGNVIAPVEACGDDLIVNDGNDEVDASAVCACFADAAATGVVSTCVAEILENNIEFDEECVGNILTIEYDLSDILVNNNFGGIIAGVFGLVLFLGALFYGCIVRPRRAQENEAMEDIDISTMPGTEEVKYIFADNDQAVQALPPPAKPGVGFDVSKLAFKANQSPRQTASTFATQNSSASFILARLSYNTMGTTNSTFNQKLLTHQFTPEELAEFKKYRNQGSAKFLNQRITMATNLTGISQLSALSVDSLSGLSDIEKTRFLRATKTFKSRQDKVIEKVFKHLEILNEKASRKLSSKVDDFYSATEVPEMGIAVYVKRLINSLDRYFQDMKSLGAVGMRSFMVSLVYIDKLKEKDENFRLTVLNQHRVFAITMLIAAKFTEDYLISNKYWSKTSGLDLDELNEIEEEFCKTTEFEFWVTEEQLQGIYNRFHLTSLAKQKGKGHISPKKR